MAKLTQAFVALKPDYMIMLPKIMARLYDVMMKFVNQDPQLKESLEFWNQHAEEFKLADPEKLAQEIFDHPIVTK